MADHTITITNGNASTGKLTLDKPNLETAKTGQKIKWKIGDNSVKSIVAILDKTGYQDIWKDRPKGHNGWEGKIKKKDQLPVPFLYVYEYSIRWEAPGGHIPPVHDPKISINPALHDSNEKSLILLTISVLMLVVSGLIFWRKRRK